MPKLQQVKSVTDTDTTLAIAKALGLENRFVLMKRGLYYRPNGNGYTSHASEAWVLSEAEADKHVYPHDEPVTKHPASLPDWLNSVDAAMQICDHVNDRFDVVIVRRKKGQLYRVYFYDGPNDYTASNASLARAICECFVNTL